MFRNVTFENCNVNSISIFKNGEIIEVAYSPPRIRELLDVEGIKILNGKQVIDNSSTIEISEFKKSLIKFILKFNRVIIQYEKSMESIKYLGNNTDLVINEIIPLCLEYEIITLVKTKNSKQASTKAWRMLVDIEELLKYDRTVSDNKFSKFWNVVNNK